MLNEQQMRFAVVHKAHRFGIEPQQVFQIYAMERLLVKLAGSPLKEYFVLKGGFLLTELYGLETRTTADLDTSIRNIENSEETLGRVIRFIESPADDSDNIESFKYQGRNDILAGSNLDGFELRFTYINGRIRIPFRVDVSLNENDALVSMNTSVKLMFSDDRISIATYPIEQILADKLSATLSLGVGGDRNSRAKDLYDIYFLTSVHSGIEYAKLAKAVNVSLMHRGLVLSSEERSAILEKLARSSVQKRIWKLFQGKNQYAAETPFDKVMQTVIELSEAVSIADAENERQL